MSINFFLGEEQMLELNKIYENVTCIDMTTEGMGICIIEERRVFVSQFFLGEVANIKIIKIRSKYVNGTIDKFITEKPVRIDSLLAKNGKQNFGGCDLQWLNYAAQLELKQYTAKKMMQLTTRDTEFTLKEIIGSKKFENYRNKMQYVLTQEANGKINACFYRKNTKTPLIVENDFLAHPQIVEFVEYLVERMQKFEVPIYSDYGKINGVRELVIRYFEKTNELMVVFISNIRKIPNLASLSHYLFDNIDNLKSIMQNINPDNSGQVFGYKTICLSGREWIQDELNNLTFNVPATAFYQINQVQAANIYNDVAKLASFDKQTTVLDFYCGIGTMTLMLAEQAAKVIGVEIEKAAVEMAKENAILNAITNAEFYNENVDSFITNYEREDAGRLVVLIDPPRKGCSELFIEQVVGLQPDEIVYVSCNPQTLARDLVQFKSLGYDYGEVQPYDMFAQTLHVETIVMLTHDLA